MSDGESVLKVAFLLVGLVIVAGLASADFEGMAQDYASDFTGTPIQVESRGLDPQTEDPQIEIDVSVVEWGTVDCGSFVERTIFITNHHVDPVVLSLGSREFVPELAAEFLKLSWDLKVGFVLDPEKTVAAKLRLDVSGNVKDIVDFSFTIVVYATAN